MDQVKEFLRQCVNYRFWIACGMALLLPTIGYFIGSGAIIEATATQEKAIKGAKSEIDKYASGSLPNAQYQPIVAEKKDVLTADVDATWRKLFAIQEPLLRWPEVVEGRFRTWGRKWPENVDRGQVQQALYDYTIDYPAFVSRVYKTFKPWNPEDGTGIVAAPDEKTLIMPANFLPDTPPDLTQVWAEQSRLWVLTAVLDAVAKINDGVGAKDWDGAIVKQINSIEVGTPTAQDQVSIAKAEVLDPAPTLSPDGVVAAPVAPAPGGPEGGGGMAGMMGMMGPGAKVDTVYSIHGDPSQQFVTLPIRMTVLVEQSKIPDFLIGLENSPMSIQIMEPEISKPTSPVVKPVYGEQMSFGMMGGMGMRGGDGEMSPGNMAGMMQGYGQRNAMMGRGPGGQGGGGSANMEGMMSMMGGYNNANKAAPKSGTSIRDQNKAAIRKDQAKKDAAKSKTSVKSKVDLYYNIVEVTVYGQARFYNTPPAPPQPTTSNATTTPEPTPATPPATPPTPAVPATPEVPAATAPKTEAPKAEVPKENPPTTNPEPPAPKS